MKKFEEVMSVSNEIENITAEVKDKDIEEFREKLNKIFKL